MNIEIPAKELLFKVTMGVGGHEYLIYTNGDVEGFGEGAIIFNHHPQIVMRCLAQASLAKGMAERADDSTTVQLTSDRLGAGHSTPW
jgi:hypothetical protein